MLPWQEKTQRCTCLSGFESEGSDNQVNFIFDSIYRAVVDNFKRYFRVFCGEVRKYIFNKIKEFHRSIDKEREGGERWGFG